MQSCIFCQKLIPKHLVNQHVLQCSLEEHDDVDLLQDSDSDNQKSVKPVKVARPVLRPVQQSRLLALSHPTGSQASKQSSSWTKPTTTKPAAPPISKLIPINSHPANSGSAHWLKNDSKLSSSRSPSQSGSKAPPVSKLVPLGAPAKPIALSSRFTPITSTQSRRSKQSDSLVSAKVRTKEIDNLLSTSSESGSEDDSSIESSSTQQEEGSSSTSTSSRPSRALPRAAQKRSTTAHCIDLADTSSDSDSEEDAADDGKPDSEDDLFDPPAPKPKAKPKAKPTTMQPKQELPQKQVERPRRNFTSATASWALPTPPPPTSPKPKVTRKVTVTKPPSALKSRLSSMVVEQPVQSISIALLSSSSPSEQSNQTSTSTSTSLPTININVKSGITLASSFEDIHQISNQYTRPATPTPTTPTPTTRTPTTPTLTPTTDLPRQSPATTMGDYLLPQAISTPYNFHLPHVATAQPLLGLLPGSLPTSKLRSNPFSSLSALSSTQRRGSSQHPSLQSPPQQPPQMVPLPPQLPPSALLSPPTFPHPNLLPAIHQMIQQTVGLDESSVRKSILGRQRGGLDPYQISTFSPLEPTTIQAYAKAHHHIVSRQLFLHLDKFANIDTNTINNTNSTNLDNDVTTTTTTATTSNNNNGNNDNNIAQPQYSFSTMSDDPTDNPAQPSDTSILDEEALASSTFAPLLASLQSSLTTPFQTLLLHLSQTLVDHQAQHIARLDEIELNHKLLLYYLSKLYHKQHLQHHLSLLMREYGNNELDLHHLSALLSKHHAATSTTSTTTASAKAKQSSLLPPKTLKSSQQQIPIDSPASTTSLDSTAKFRIPTKKEQETGKLPALESVSATFSFLQDPSTSTSPSTDDLDSSLSSQHEIVNAYRQLCQVETRLHSACSATGAGTQLNYRLHSTLAARTRMTTTMKDSDSEDSDASDESDHPPPNPLISPSMFDQLPPPLRQALATFNLTSFEQPYVFQPPPPLTQNRQEQQQRDPTANHQLSQMDQIDLPTDQIPPPTTPSINYDAASIDDALLSCLGQIPPIALSLLGLSLSQPTPPTTVPASSPLPQNPDPLQTAQPPVSATSTNPNTNASWYSTLNSLLKQTLPPSALVANAALDQPTNKHSSSNSTKHPQHHTTLDLLKSPPDFAKYLFAKAHPLNQLNLDHHKTDPIISPHPTSPFSSPLPTSASEQAADLRSQHQMLMGDINILTSIRDHLQTQLDNIVASVQPIDPNTAQRTTVATLKIPPSTAQPHDAQGGSNPTVLDTSSRPIDVYIPMLPDLQTYQPASTSDSTIGRFDSLTQSSSAQVPRTPPGFLHPQLNALRGQRSTQLINLQASPISSHPSTRLGATQLIDGDVLHFGSESVSSPFHQPLTQQYLPQTQTMGDSPLSPTIPFAIQVVAPTATPPVVPAADDGFIDDLEHYNDVYGGDGYGDDEHQYQYGFSDQEPNGDASEPPVETLDASSQSTIDDDFGSDFSEEEEEAQTRSVNHKALQMHISNQSANYIESLLESFDLLGTGDDSLDKDTLFRFVCQSASFYSVSALGDVRIIPPGQAAAGEAEPLSQLFPTPQEHPVQPGLESDPAAFDFDQSQFDPSSVFDGFDGFGGYESYDDVDYSTMGTTSDSFALTSFDHGESDANPFLNQHITTTAPTSSATATIIDLNTPHKSAPPRFAIQTPKPPQPIPSSTATKPLPPHISTTFPSSSSHWHQLQLDTPNPKVRPSPIPLTFISPCLDCLLTLWFRAPPQRLIFHRLAINHPVNFNQLYTLLSYYTQSHNTAIDEVSTLIQNDFKRVQQRLASNQGEASVSTQDTSHMVQNVLLLLTKRCFNAVPIYSQKNWTKLKTALSKALQFLQQITQLHEEFAACSTIPCSCPHVLKFHQLCNIPHPQSQSALIPSTPSPGSDASSTIATQSIDKALETMATHDMIDSGAIFHIFAHLPVFISATITAGKKDGLVKLEAFLQSLLSLFKFAALSRPKLEAYLSDNAIIVI